MILMIILKMMTVFAIFIATLIYNHEDMAKKRWHNKMVTLLNDELTLCTYFFLLVLYALNVDRQWIEKVQNLLFSSTHYRSLNKNGIERDIGMSDGITWLARNIFVQREANQV